MVMGASETKVQLLLGHKTSLMTKRYVHLADTDTIDAVALLDTEKVSTEMSTVVEMPQRESER
jgi:hypothetical protein